MPPKKEVFTVIKDEEHWNSLYTEENKKLLVLDVFPTWSGPCEIMFPTWKTQAQTVDDFDKRLEFLMFDATKIKPPKAMTVSCRPKFFFVLQGKVIDEVNGANVPEILEKIQKYIPLDT